jgi:tRNA-binding protein
MPTTPLSFDQFLATDIRVGRIVAARLNPAALKPAFHLEVDFGAELGVKHSSAQLTVHYTEASLLGMLVIAVVNFEPKRIAGVRSEVLVLGVPDQDGAVVLLNPGSTVPLGGRMF